MIKEIFLPEKIGNRRLYSQKIVGLAVREDIVSLVLVNAKRSATIVEKVVEEKIQDVNDSKEIINALKTAISKVKAFDQVRVAISASLVIFKEIVVPFTDHEKIRMILGYEIEPMLPFSLDEAIIDFIVTGAAKEKNSSQVLVAAIRKEDLKQVIDQYKSAGIEPTSLTLDLFALYGLAQQVPKYQEIKHGNALIDLGLFFTRVSFIYDGQLRLTRNISRGLSTIITQISDNTGVDKDKVLFNLQTFGINPTEDDKFDKVTKEHFINFFNDIQFTLNSFSLKLSYYKGVTQILFSGKAHEIYELEKFCNDLLQIPSEIFDIKKLFANKTIKNKVVSEPQAWDTHLVSLGAAVPENKQERFNLRRKSFALMQHKLIGRQIIAAVVILFIMLTSIAISGYQQISHLQKAATDIEKKEVNKLLGIIPKKERPKTIILSSLVRKAENLVKDKQEVCASFSQQKMKPLDILLEVTNIMDKRLFNFELTELSIKEKEADNIIVGIDGHYQSSRGTGYHLRDWLDLEKRFTESALLVPVETIDAIPAADAEKGVRFSIKLRNKEES
jgi:type IV pilus assembly protein PilM